MHGGYRQGAGRKNGSKTKKRVDEALKAAEEGLTPLAYMLEVMRSPMPPELVDLIASMNAEGRLDDEITSRLLSWHSMRFAAAKGAAPYMHPHLQTTVVKGEGEGGAVKLIIANA